MKKVSQRRRFHPYTSRKSMKRATGFKTHSGGLVKPQDFGVATFLINALMGRSSQRGR